jgi:hypothetical protein
MEPLEMLFEAVDEVIANLKTELPVSDDSVQSAIIAQFLMTGSVTAILKDSRRYSYAAIKSEGGRLSWYRRVIGP